MTHATLPEITGLLTLHGIRSSGPRISIYDYLCRNRIHPTAETVYRSLHTQQPSLSLMTVYNTLKLFERKGLVVSLPIEGSELRYDVRVDFHAHFKCRICGAVYDVETSSPAQGPEGFITESASINYYGVCPDCISRQPLQRVRASILSPSATDIEGE